MPLDLNTQIHPSAKKHSVTCSQHYETHPTVRLSGSARLYRQADQVFISFTFTVLAAGAMLQFDSDK